MDVAPLIEFKMLEDNSTLVIKLPPGAFDAGKLMNFKEKVNEAWSENVRQVRFDFAQVTFIDSPAIGAILSVYRRLSGDAKPVRIDNPNNTIRSTLHIFRLDEVFELK
ncbi:MAG: STAS domain-containing protein [Verrucomicrobiota bacterium]|nr:STAS domain-containing protein [Verrucomicrobiota bacterium]